MNFVAYSYVEGAGKLNHIFISQNKEEQKCKERQYCCKVKITALEILFFLQLFHPSFNPMTFFFFLIIFSGWLVKQNCLDLGFLCSS